jgi:hypothetical protein
LRACAHRILLGALFAVWVAAAWRPLERQYAALDAWRARLAGRPVEERAALVDYPAYLVARQILPATPPDACILFLAYTGPEHVNYYKTRFDYYLYPRRVLIHADTGATAENCSYLALFHDSPANLREEPFRGAWDDEQLRARLAGLEPVLAGQHVALYREKR